MSAIKNSCATISGISEYDLCTPNMGGIARLWVCNRTDVESITTGTSQTIVGNCITDIEMASGKTFQEVFIKKNTCSMTSELQIGDGSSYVQTTLEIALRRQDSQKRMFINSMILGECYVIVEDSNHYKTLLGYDEPVVCSAGGAETGTAKGDINQYTLSLQDESLDYPFEVEESAFLAAIGEDNE